MSLFEKTVKIKLMDYEIDPEFFINALDDVKRAIDNDKFKSGKFCHESTEDYVFCRTEKRALSLLSMKDHDEYYALCIIEYANETNSYIHHIVSLAEGDKESIFIIIEELKEYFSN